MLLLANVAPVRIVLSPIHHLHVNTMATCVTYAVAPVGNEVNYSTSKIALLTPSTSLEKPLILKTMNHFETLISQRDFLRLQGKS